MTGERIALLLDRCQFGAYPSQECYMAGFGLPLREAEEEYGDIGTQAKLPGRSCSENRALRRGKQKSGWGCIRSLRFELLAELFYNCLGILLQRPSALNQSSEEISYPVVHRKNPLAKLRESFARLFAAFDGCELKFGKQVMYELVSFSDERLQLFLEVIPLFR